MKNSSYIHLIFATLFTVFMLGGCSSIAPLTANDRLARSSLEALLLACDYYAHKNSEQYPADVQSLANALPPEYIDVRKYCGGEAVEGFLYNCTFSPEGCEFRAVPEIVGTSGSKDFIAAKAKNGEMMIKHVRQ